MVCSPKAWAISRCVFPSTTLASMICSETGQISGVALDGEGQPLAAQAVRLKRVFITLGDRAEEVSGRDTTDADGAFSFTGLQASDYLVEVLNDDEVVASSATTLEPGAMLAVRAEAPDNGGVHPAVWVGVGVGATFLVLFLIACGPSGSCGG